MPDIIVPPNPGGLITRLNTGFDANVSNSGIGAWSAVTPTGNGSGYLDTTQSGQTITEVKHNGVIRVRHPNCTIVGNDIWGIDILNGIMGTKIYFNDIGLMGGMRYNGGFGLTCIQGGDYTSVRNRIYGWIDLTRPRWGDTKHVEDWFGPPFSDPEGHKWPPDTPRRRAHCDPSQPHPPPSSSLTFSSVLYENCKFEIFPFNLGQQWLDQIGIYNETYAATAGMINTEFGQCNNGTIRGCYFVGNCHQVMYIISGDNNTLSTPPQNWAVIDNQFDDGNSGLASFGHSHFMNFGKHSSKPTEPAVTWGRNVDVRTGQTLAAFYTAPRRFGTNHSWSRTINAGPSENYPTFYGSDGGGDDGGGNPNPTIQLKITTPAADSVHTSGTVTFVGGADTAAGDTDTAYSFMDYWISFPDEVQSGGSLGTGGIHLDHDKVTNNNGFLFDNITADGVTFTRRNGTAPETHKGRAELLIVGTRNDGTFPEKKIEVTFGDVTPPEPSQVIGFNMNITAKLEATPKLNTSLGGIPKTQVKQVLKRVPTAFKWTSVTIWDEELGGTGEEVVPLDADNFKRRYE